MFGVFAADPPCEPSELSSAFRVDGSGHAEQCWFGAGR